MPSVTRSIPPWLAPIVEQLELDRPEIVTTRDLSRLTRRLGMREPTNRIIQVLAELGWLLKTGVHGVWEFAPAERAGPHSVGDHLLPLRASLAATPGVPVALALSSAMWFLDIADRAPDVAELAMPPGAYIPAALNRAYRVVRFRSNVEPTPLRGVPVHTPASILVHLAHRPSDVRGWAGVLIHLSELVGAAHESGIFAELGGRPHSTQVRLAYLLSGVAPELVERLGAAPAGKVWFGPRGPLRRHSARWNIADTILPFSPTELLPSQ